MKDRKEPLYLVWDKGSIFYRVYVKLRQHSLNIQRSCYQNRNPV